MVKKFVVEDSNSVKYSDPNGGEVEVYSEGDDVSHLPKETLMSLAEAGSIKVVDSKAKVEEKEEENPAESPAKATAPTPAPPATKSASSASKSGS